MMCPGVRGILRFGGLVGFEVDLETASRFSSLTLSAQEKLVRVQHCIFQALYTISVMARGEEFAELSEETVRQ